MYLKNLTLRGFKTFADKTTMEFEQSPAITAIVGPNGCGKSNVVDALRFVIGEQSMKEMRGEFLSQVIFAGSTARKALSVAEVSILLDNSDGKLKTDYSEVMIRRRVFRSGESEFYINKNLCRLRDIKELFLDTGISLGAYSIVSQGQIDAILSSKPEDRRALFEEAASIGKYKFKKKAAERRLISTEQNLLRINDLRGEIKENIASLEIQAAKAKEYKEIKESLKILEIGLSKKQVKYLSEKKDAYLVRIEELRNKTMGVEEGTLREEEEKNALKNLLKELESSMEEIRLKMDMTRKNIEDSRSGLSVGNERLAQLSERIEFLKLEKQRVENILITKYEELTKLGYVKESNQEVLFPGAPKRSIDEVKKDIEKEKNDIRALIRSYAESINALEKEASSLTRVIQDSKNKISVGKERVIQLSERLQQLSSEKIRIQSTLEIKEKKLQSDINELAEYDNKYGQARKYLDDAKITFDDICKRIEESIRGWNNLKNPIHQREMDISSRKHSLAEIELGLRFANESLSKDKSFLDNLTGLKDDIAFFESEISKADIFQELKERISERKNIIYKKLDVEIEIINKSVSEKKLEVDKMQRKWDEETNALNGLETTTKEMTEQFMQLEKKMKELTSEKEKAIEHLAETRTIYTNFENTSKQRNQEIADLKKELVSLQSDIIAKGKEIESIQIRIGETESDNEQNEKNLPSITEMLSTKEAALNDIRSKSLAEQEKSKIFDRITEIDHDLKSKTREIETIETRLVSTSAEVEKLQIGLPSMLEEENSLSAELQKMFQKRSVEQNKLEILEEKIKSISNEDRYLRELLSKEEISLAKVEGELGSIEAVMSQEYQLTVADVLISEIEEPSSTSKAKEEVERSKSALLEIGPVNLLAVEEYEVAKGRMEFIDNQYNDLVSARENLNSLIRELDSEAVGRFVQTIEEVNKHFSELFSTLFEGGEAKIELGEGDPLECGIEITAKPSGKKWLSLSLMSGGEKALTAISILFALMKVNPGPFCFMDEVDAALDEINTIRFTKLLKDFAQHTQIVVITHSKRTMSAANTMYGVTMEEPGISKLVSMKLVKVAD